MRLLLLLIISISVYGQEDPKKLLNSEWMHAEQALPSETPTGSNIRNYLAYLTSQAKHNGDLAEEYHPKAAKVYSLGELTIPEEYALVVSNTGDVPDEFIKTEIGGKRILTFPFHPSQVSFYGVPIGEEPTFKGTPSSSARSMFVKKKGSNTPFIFKASLNMGMGGFGRLIPVDEAVRAQYNTALFQTLHEETKGRLKSGMNWGFFPEVATIFPKDLSLGGTTLRTIPKELMKKDQVLLPMYSLIAKRKNSKGQKLPTWIERLYKDSGYTNKEKFIIDKFSDPIMDLFSIITYKAGLTSQMHQQNLLAQVVKKNGKYQVVGFYLRDMEALFPIYSLEKYLGIKRKVDLFNSVDVEKAKKMGAKYMSKPEIHRYDISSSRFLQGYREDLRHNSIKSIFKYFLDNDQMDNVLINFDQRMVSEYNQRVPKAYQVDHIRDFEKKFFDFDASILKKYNPKILKQRRIFNETVGHAIGSYERWLSQALQYNKRPSEKMNLCFFYIKNFYQEKIIGLPRSRY